MSCDNCNCDKLKEENKILKISLELACQQLAEYSKEYYISRTESYNEYMQEQPKRYVNIYIKQAKKIKRSK